MRWRLGLCAAALTVVAASCGGSPLRPLRRRACQRRTDRQLRRPGGHPQDQAHHRDPAGEPVLRLLLRDLSRRRRDPDEERRAHRLRERPQDGAVCRALRRPRRRQRGWAPLGTERHGRRQRREDGRLHRAGRGRPQGLPGAHRPGLLQLGDARRDGLPHAKRHPQLLDLCEGLRPAGPHVRAERLVEPAGPPLPGVGVVRLLHPGRQSLELHERLADKARRAPAERAGGLRRRGQDPRTVAGTPSTATSTRGRVSPFTPGPT